VDGSSHDINIKNFFRTIELAPNTTPQAPLSPSPNPNSQLYPEVQRHNQDLVNEENELFRLMAELQEIIDEKNNKGVCQEAQALGLNLPNIPVDVLDFFQEEFFQKLDETSPLTSYTNVQISIDNGIIRQKKMNIKDNVYQIFNSNTKKLADKIKEQQNSSPHQPESELEKLKREFKERIDEILTDKDNLRNINLATLDNGKFQN
jgi:hypothetical protein